MSIWDCKREINIYNRLFGVSGVIISTCWCFVITILIQQCHYLLLLTYHVVDIVLAIYKATNNMTGYFWNITIINNYNMIALLSSTVTWCNSSSGDFSLTSVFSLDIKPQSPWYENLKLSRDIKRIFSSSRSDINQKYQQ